MQDDDETHGFDTHEIGVVLERGAGLTIHAHKASPWLSWDETLALAKWLAEQTADKPAG